MLNCDTNTEQKGLQFSLKMKSKPLLISQNILSRSSIFKHQDSHHDFTIS